MNPAHFDRAFILTGPTASGKSAVAMVLAERLDAEIVAMDSMTLYRGMDIGTAKPSRADRARVPHHLIDILEPWESASLAWWLDRAAESADAITARGKRVLFVGGTPLYLKALLRGIFAGPAADSALREQLEQHSGPELQARLAEVDPPTAARLHFNDKRRMIRALEVHTLTGKPMSAWQQEFAMPRPRTPAPVWINPPREALYERINRRVGAMMDAGLEAEVRRLEALPQPLSKEARQALGYKELLDASSDRESIESAVARIQLRSRNFAKRQGNWFRHLPECHRLEIAAEETPKVIAERILSLPGWQ